jgi:hypothetical protein
MEQRQERPVAKLVVKRSFICFQSVGVLAPETELLKP